MQKACVWRLCLHFGNCPGAGAVHPEALGGREVAEIQEWREASDTLVWGGSGLFAASWLFLSLKGVLLEKS